MDPELVDQGRREFGEHRRGGGPAEAVARAGRRLVDGGAVANVPVGIAQHMGARHVIVVDISSPLEESVEKKYMLGKKQAGSLLKLVNVLIVFGRKLKNLRK